MNESEVMHAFDEARKQEWEKYDQIHMELYELIQLLIEDTKKTKRQKRVQENVALIIELYQLIFHK